MITVTVLSAFGVDDRHQGFAAAYERIYLGPAIALGFTLGPILVVALTVSGLHHIMLVAEVVVIVLFGSYWAVQTRKLWNLRATSRGEGRHVDEVAQ
ncbi:hypothetical protein [Humibacillus sp. DSM 29435]|uniref:hypothetical protein n=1 Tax=Humibacillus sp. DSM 29435 TaxID=1869167 RepID=UPI0011131009|nr:hypothetical protein [Humibacillus sp. DSM 29435]